MQNENLTNLQYESDKRFKFKTRTSDDVLREEGELIFRAKTPVVSIKHKPVKKRNKIEISQQRVNINLVRIPTDYLNKSNEYKDRYISRYKQRMIIHKAIAYPKRLSDLDRSNIRVNSVLSHNERKDRGKRSFLRSDSPVIIKRYHQIESILKNYYF